MSAHVPDGLHVSHCESCQAPIIWIKWSSSGQWTPIDHVPAADGRLAIDGRFVRMYRESDEKAGAPRYKTHFATCPNAAQHRRPK